MGEEAGAASGDAAPKRGVERKAVLVRLDPAVHSALQRWAADELRSVNAQVEIVIRDALRAVGRAPRDAGPVPKRGRPPKDPGRATEGD